MAQDLKYHSMVRMYRIQSGLRQEDLAREVDVSRRTIITAESDNCNLSLATALRLAAYFQRTVDELFVQEERLIRTRKLTKELFLEQQWERVSVPERNGHWKIR